MRSGLRNADPYRLFLFMGAVWSLATSMMWTIAAVYRVQEVGMTPFQLVLVGTILEGTYFLFEVPTGVVADVVSRRLSVIIAYLLLGAGFIIQGLFPLVSVTLAAEVIIAIGFTFESGALQAWLADEIGQERFGPALLRNSQVARLVGFLGIGLGVWLATVRLALPIVVGGSTLVLLGLLLALVMPETGFQPTRRETSGRNEMGRILRSSFTSLRTNRLILMFFLVELFWGGHSEGFDRLWEAHFLQNFTFPAVAELEPVVWFGIINAVSGLFSILLVETVRRRVDTANTLQLARIIFLAYGLVLSGVLLFGLAGPFGLALAAYWLVEVSRSIGQPLMWTWLNQEIPSENRATLLSMIGQGNALGQVAAGPVVGWIGTVRSLRAAMVACSLLLSPAVALFGRASLRPLSVSPASASSEVASPTAD